MQFGWITIGVAVIVAMRGCLVFWRHMEGLHVVLIGDPVGFETNLALKCVVRSTQAKLDMDLAPEVGANLSSFDLVEQLCVIVITIQL